MEHYHQISAFAAAKQQGSDAVCAYAAYDNGELQITRRATIPCVSEHRASLMAVWSAVRWCKEHRPAEGLDVYTADKRVADELTAVWYGDGIDGLEDSDRIVSVLLDCCHIGRTAFGFIAMDEDGAAADYARRMRELEQTLEQ